MIRFTELLIKSLLALIMGIATLVASIVTLPAWVLFWLKNLIQRQIK